MLDFTIVSLILFVVIYPKALLLSTIRRQYANITTTKFKTKVVDYIPLFNSIEVSKVLNLGILKRAFIADIVFMICSFSATFVIRTYFETPLNVFIVVACNVLSILIYCILDMLLSYRLCKLFKRNDLYLFILVSPILLWLVSSKIHIFFKTYKDTLSGAFDV